MIIDMHSHFLPDTLVEYLRKKGSKLETEIIKKGSKEYISHPTCNTTYELYPEFWDYEAKRALLDRMGVDKAVLSIAPSCYFYWVNAADALEACRIANDWVSAFCRKHPERFGAMATVPIQDTATALKELRRAHETLGINALATAPIVNGRMLDEEAFFPIYEYCAKEGILIFLHPANVPPRPEYASYYNGNAIGNVLETNIGINHLIFGGVFEKYPDLKVFAAHGGGYFPYQLGRLKHVYKVRQEPRKHITKSPEDYLKTIYYDTITHWDESLQFLVNSFGADHVMLGTDTPFDMGDYQPVEHVKELKLSPAERERIFSGNANRLLGLE